MADLVECRLCPWRIDPIVDGWEDALAAHLQHHRELEEAPMTKCKVDGCDQDAVAALGMYALLCDQHKYEKQQLKAAVPQAVQNGNGRLTLAELGRAVDDARRQLDQAVGALREALER